MADLDQAALEAAMRAYDPIGWAWYDRAVAEEQATGIPHGAIPIWLADQTKRIGAAIRAYEAALWEPIKAAKAYGGRPIVYTNAVQDPPAFVTCARYHPDVGWRVDELREDMFRRSLPDLPSP